LLVGAAAVEAATRAVAEGYDAIVINSVLDYGLRAVRSAVPIPVVGPGQASMLLACQLGHRFSIVSIFSPSIREIHSAQLREYQLTERCAAMRFTVTDAEMATIAEPDSFYARARSRRQDMIERIGEQVRAAVEQDGADAIVLGCTCMAPIAGDLAALTDASVINPLDAAFLQAEQMVRLGVTHSPRAYWSAEALPEQALMAMMTAVAPHFGLESDSGDACAMLGDRTVAMIAT
jgi:allantoin racemase